MERLEYVETGCGDSLKLNYDWDWPGAEASLKRIVELNPDHATARQRYSLFLSAMGRHQESIAEIQRALTLDPLSIRLGSSEGIEVGCGQSGSNCLRCTCCVPHWGSRWRYNFANPRAAFTFASRTRYARDLSDFTYLQKRRHSLWEIQIVIYKFVIDWTFQRHHSDSQRN
ncbi:MAG: tetratricopeptide repeat protein [Candidatus Acidiferrales bacterium]